MRSHHSGISSMHRVTIPALSAPRASPSQLENIKNIQKALLNFMLYDSTVSVKSMSFAVMFMLHATITVMRRMMMCALRQRGKVVLWLTMIMPTAMMIILKILITPYRDCRHCTTAAWQQQHPYARRTDTLALSWCIPWVHNDTQHVTRHTSHIIRHTSHISSHKSPRVSHCRQSRLLDKVGSSKLTASAATHKHIAALNAACIGCQVTSHTSSHFTHHLC